MSRLEETGRASIRERWIMLALVIMQAIAIVAFSRAPSDRLLGVMAGWMIGTSFGSLMFGYFIERGGDKR